MLVARGAALLLVLSSCATAPAPAPEVPPLATSIPIKVEKPEGAGPFPAVVLLHDCSGLGPRSSGSPGRWAKLLVAQGYVVAMPDSFSTRGFPAGVCVDPSPKRMEVAPRRRVADADEALAHLRTLPYVDAKRIGIMGGSHGGATTLVAMSRKEPRFAAAVSLYPACNRLADSYRGPAPLLILAGELDDWTPAAACARLAENARRAGAPVAIKIYPGAHHSFDSANPVRFVPTRMNENAPGGRGATTGGHAEAWADSIREVTEFFARHVRDR